MCKLRFGDLVATCIEVQSRVVPGFGDRSSYIDHYALPSQSFGLSIVGLSRVSMSQSGKNSPVIDSGSEHGTNKR